jgi:hypothetical protein
VKGSHEKRTLRNEHGTKAGHAGDFDHFQIPTMASNNPPNSSRSPVKLDVPSPSISGVAVSPSKVPTSKSWRKVLAASLFAGGLIAVGLTVGLRKHDSSSTSAVNNNAGRSSSSGETIPGSNTVSTSSVDIECVSSHTSWTVQIWNHPEQVGCLYRDDVAKAIRVEDSAIVDLSIEQGHSEGFTLKAFSEYSAQDNACAGTLLGVTECPELDFEDIEYGSYSPTPAPTAEPTAVPTSQPTIAIEPDSYLESILAGVLPESTHNLLSLVLPTSGADRLASYIFAASFRESLTSIPATAGEIVSDEIVS